MVDEINRRFREGIPSNSLATAGVLVHEFDKLEDWEHDTPWKTCSKSSENSWCTDQAKHESCTLINKELPHLFVEAPNTAADDPSDGSMGFILSPRVTEILCSFYADGGTQGQPDGGCFHTVHDGIKKPVPKCNPQPAGCDQVSAGRKRPKTRGVHRTANSKCPAPFPWSEGSTNALGKSSRSRLVTV